MATQLERLSEALKRADEAGNEEDARKIAQAIQQLRSQGAASGAQQSGESETQQGSLLGRAADFVTGIPGAVAEAARGPEGLPDLPEFDAPAPSTGKTIKAAAGLMASASPEQQRDIIASNYPGAEIESVEADGKQYQIVNWTDPEGETHRGYINAPGFSTRDATQLAGQALAFTPAGRVGRGLSAVQRALRAAPAAGATSAALDVGAGQAGSEQGVSLQRAGITGLVGGGAEFLAPAAGAVWRTMRGRSQFFNNRTGRLTAEGRRHAEQAGLSADDISDLDSHSQRTFARFLESGIDPEAGMRVARTAEFQIPVTRGQATRSGSQLTTEERIQAGALGETSQGRLAQFGEQQQEAIEQAAGGIQQRLGGAAAREAEAGETVMTGVRRVADDLRQKIDEAYEGVRGQTRRNTGIPFDESTIKAGDPLRESDVVIEVDPRQISERLTPNTFFPRSADELREMSRGQGVRGNEARQMLSRRGELETFVDEGGRASLPEISINGRGQVDFGNGRNRFLLASERGATSIPVAVSKEEADRFTQAGLTVNRGFAIAPEAAEQLPARISSALEDFDLTPDLTPAAVRAVDVVGEMTDAVAKGEGARFETFRRRLGGLIGSAKNKTDRNAATRVKRAFDDWLDDSVEQGLFEGNPETLSMLKEARSLRSQYGRQFEALDNTDTAGKIMQNIVEKADSPEQVVNYIFGQSALGRKGASTSAVQRIKQAVGEDSETWDAIREMAWLRLSRNRQGDFVGGKLFKRNFNDLKNRNKSLMDSLFKPDEQRLMSRFAQAVDVTSPPRQNPSGTAASLENAIRYTLRRFGQRESFTKGNVGKGTILNFMARMRLPMAGRALGGSPAGRAMDVRPPRPGAPGFVSGAAAAGRVSGPSGEEE